MRISKTNKYQLTEAILQLQNVTNLYTNTTVTNFTRPIFDVFYKSKDCIAALNHIRCTVPEYATPEGYGVYAKGRCECLGKCEDALGMP